MPTPDRNWLRRFRRNVNRWYEGHARDLPWRRTDDAYHIWVSEIMLQQTTVAAVVPYFERFIKRFPTPSKLAEATESEVLRHWEGLGYYSRARNLHKAAKRLVAEYGGRLPGTAEELATLPGIGRYTAGAIASCAFGRRAPIVEANTVRLYSRLLGFRGDPRSSEGQALLWQFAEDILPQRSPGDFNQAVMDIGATICTPNDPRCENCPVRSCCRALEEGAQAQIPLRAKRREITHLTEAAIAVRNGNSILLTRRQAGEWWAGLWDFPRIPLEKTSTAKPKSVPRRSNGDEPGARLTRDMVRGVTLQTGIIADAHEFLSEIRHTVTHHRIRLLCFSAVYQSGELTPGRELTWVPIADLTNYALSTTGRELANLICGRPE